MGIEIWWVLSRLFNIPTRSLLCQKNFREREIPLPNRKKCGALQIQKDVGAKAGTGRAKSDSWTIISLPTFVKERLFQLFVMFMAVFLF